jgi:hypothetical protein
VKGLCSSFKLAAKSYDAVTVDARGQFTSAAVRLVLNLAHRPHYVTQKRRQFEPWAYQMRERVELISDADIWRAAQFIIKRHGEDAPLAAARRADELFEQGDLGGAAVWKRILHAA